MSQGSEVGVSYPSPSYPWPGFRPILYPMPLEPVTPLPVPGTQPVIPAPVAAPPPRVYFTREATDTTKMVTLKQIIDDGAGGFESLDGGTINYTSGAVHFKPVDTYVYRTYHGSRNPDGSGEIGNWTEATDTDAWADGSLIRVWFRPDSVTPTARSENLAAQRIVINLNPYSGDAVMPGSVMFKIGAAVFVDRLGILYRDPSVTTGSGIAAGTIDYAAGIATVTDWAEGDATFELLSLLTVRGNWDDTGAEFRTPASPIKPEALSITAVAIDGTQISGSADANGDITGALVRGAIDYEVGTAWLEFGEMGDDPDYVGDPPIPQIWLPRAVDPASIRYNAVAYSYLPLDAGIIGIDPVRLPSDGRVPIFRAGQVAIIMHTATTAPATIANGGSIDCGRTRLAWVRVLDANGDTISTGYTLDRATGIVTVPDITGMAMPISVQHTVADLRLLTDVQINGDIKLARPLSHAFPANETLISSCLVHGDRRARVSGVWDQATWDSTWTDAAVGPEATATLDTIAHPIVVTNEGAETERWLLRWTSTTNVELIGQTRGLVYSGPYTNDIAPINPRTREPDGSGGVPYLSIPLAANGGGWSAGNVVRINTVGAIADIWIARSIQQSDEPLDDGADGCEIYALGNIDRP